jgi:hypothetical protein
MTISCTDRSIPGFLAASLPDFGVMRRGVIVLVIGGLVAGCGTSDDRLQARATVDRFYAAVSSEEGARACRELSLSALAQIESQSGQDCPEVITRLEYSGGAIVGTEVYVSSAKVDLRGGESAFLDREPGGWKISALACKPERGKPQDRPFECEVEG